jgi:hypothetical protein
VNAPDRIATFDLLEPEWDRIEALALCLVETRQGREPPAELLATLAELQQAVSRIRKVGGWSRLPVSDLSPIEMDALAAVAAAELQPRVGWLLQSLQGGAGPYASAALLQSLLALRGGEIVELRCALIPQAPLVERRLVSGMPGDPYAPLRLDPEALSRLTGWPELAMPPPGATLVRQPAGWGDLVLPELQLRMLREFLLWVRARHRVVEDWGGQDTGGPLALFSGPSGAGKTFAARVLAAELGWPLYRVDLGMLVSKYIGETEKNLNRLFDAAHGREMVLQFDEADALLGKRAEVKEARDRYANMEVSHLLSRIEQHRGPCILTTNLRSHLDSAFTRRFQAVIEFPRPDAAARAALWARLLPPGAPRADDVEPALLGRAVAVTGGGIRNAALHAAYLAAGEDRPITLADVAVAVWRELGKAGKPLARGELGELAAHLPASETGGAGE